MKLKQQNQYYYCSLFILSFLLVPLLIPNNLSPAPQRMVLSPHANHGHLFTHLTTLSTLRYTNKPPPNNLTLKLENTRTKQNNNHQHHHNQNNPTLLLPYLLLILYSLINILIGILDIIGSSLDLIFNLIQ